MRARFQRWVLDRLWLTFVVMGASFLVFGAVTLNLVALLNANIQLLLEHGWLAAMDGGVLQLVELIANALVGMLAWILFKACEVRLVAWLIHKES